MTHKDLTNLARKYGVHGIHFGGCVAGKALGYKGAMRRSGHAHCFPKYEGRWYRWICIKSSHIEKVIGEDGKPNHLFWHEVGHIYHRSWTEGKCDEFADRQLASQ